MATQGRTNLHELAELRSLAFHQAVAARLRVDTRVLETARQRAASWALQLDGSAFYAKKWLELLAQPIERIEATLCDPGEQATALRQATPFAGAIPPKERRRIWREVRERFEAGT